MENGLALTESAVLDHLHTLLCNLLLMDSVPADYDLMASGVLNSSMFLELFVELERQFDIRITGADVNQENFRTLESIARFVRAKRAEA
ncbi:acyl carrier protein [Streptomyces sp. TG1A-8]|uniref:acyl carrier protein n=1 Tax=Streptomyces sp. TG1A-8 TaxID=3051385 RepID=UPI00265C2675|nr:acyl carrier protein [Streptomyces sp. TG1A-8]MDO0924962.1 acyl carrier protein [Streptomyces sp. TG1A-8]